eukprot:3820065-Heterocapsa_arctica.AAC.1
MGGPCQRKHTDGRHGQPGVVPAASRGNTILGLDFGRLVGEGAVLIAELVRAAHLRSLRGPGVVSLAASNC